MAKQKTKTSAEKATRKAQNQKKYIDRIKSDPVKYNIYKEKERQRYLRKKQDKKVLSIDEKSERQKRLQRKLWRKNCKAYYDRQKEKKKKEAACLKRDEQQQKEDMIPRPLSPEIIIIQENRDVQSPTSSLEPTASFEAIETVSNHSTPKSRRTLYSQPKLVDFVPLSPATANTSNEQRRITRITTRSTTSGTNITKQKKNRLTHENNLVSSKTKNTNTSLEMQSMSESDQRSFSPASNSSATSAASSTLTTNSTATLNRKQRYRSSKVISHLKQSIHHLQNLNNMYRKRMSRLENQLKKKNDVEDSDEEIKDLVYNIPETAKRNIVIKQLKESKAMKKGLATSYLGLDYKRKEAIRKSLDPLKQNLQDNSLAHIMRPLTRKSRKQIQTINNRKEEVKTFFLDEETSQFGAAKKEFLTRNTVRMQKRYLTDSLKNLHKKFNKNNSQPVSYSFFCKQRPFWVIPPIEKTRETCACKVHQNLELLISALKKREVIQEKNSTEILETTCCDVDGVNCLKRICSDCDKKVVNIHEFDNSQMIEYFYWQSKTKEIKTNTNTFKTVRVMEKTLISTSPKEAISTLNQMLKDFYPHVANIKNQFQFIRDLKNNLQECECLIHIDFSENFATKHAVEPQSCHFQYRSQISIHTVVLYFRDYSYEASLQTKSICTVSECSRHDVAAIWAHLVPVLEYIQENLPRVNILHVLSDSPSSQYRNKGILHMISQLKCDLPQLHTVCWNYQETGHGKGAPDGLGATLKRTADRAVLHGRDIANLNQFVDVVKETQIIIKTISETDIQEKSLLIPSDLKTFKGMMKVHQAVWSQTSNKIALRSLSCGFPLCKYEPSTCNHGHHLGFYTEKADTACKNQSNRVIQTGKASEIILNKRKVCSLRISLSDDLSLPSGMMEQPEDLPLSVSDLCRNLNFSEDLRDVIEDQKIEDNSLIDPVTGFIATEEGLQQESTKSSPLLIINPVTGAMEMANNSEKTEVERNNDYLLDVYSDEDIF